MANTKPRKRLGAKVPRLPDHTKFVIARFLYYVREFAERGEKACAEMQSLNPHLPGVSGNIDYWIRIRQAIDFAVSKLEDKQPWIMDIAAQDPLDLMMPMVPWCLVQSAVGVGYIKADQSPTCATAEQSPSISTHTDEQPAPSDNATPTPEKPCSEPGKGSKARNCRRSKRTPAEQSQPKNGQGKRGRTSFPVKAAS